MILVERYRGRPVVEQRVEVVERKGKGHPDYICDAVMDSISVALCAEYIKHAGMVLHHNIDKGMLAAGRTEKEFGTGRITKPMELIIGDRATFEFKGTAIPVSDIAREAAQTWFEKNLRFVDPRKDIKFTLVLAESSEELTDIFARPGEVRGANDTSAAIGYYPLSPTEQAVLRLERHLNSSEFKTRFPETGEDVKVMGLRTGTSLDVTVAMPLLCRHISSEKNYFACKKILRGDMVEYLRESCGSDFKRITVHYNTLDTKGRGTAGTYLTVLGTSAEDADSGQVGRGNRVNGLISINRPLGTEAAAGKNPVSHVGKIYNVLAHKIAREVYEASDAVEEVHVLLLSTIGAPIDRPKIGVIQILPRKTKTLRELKPRAEEIFHRELEAITELCIELALGKHPVC
jgi:S-adenosylmethionine synthetase